MLRLIATTVVIIFTGINTWFFTHKEEFLDLKPITVETAEADLKIYVELAITPSEKSMGLMNREGLKEGRGMLFVYSKPQLVSFWMKNMLMSIDMIFIGDDLNIKHISHNATPCTRTPCTFYRPPGPVQYILEVPNGYSEKHQIKVGDHLLMEFLEE